MDGVGTMNACTSVVVPNSRIRMLMVHSLTKSRVDSINLFMIRYLGDGIAVKQHEGSLPSGLREEILRQIEHVRRGSIDELFSWSVGAS